MLQAISYLSFELRVPSSALIAACLGLGTLTPGTAVHGEKINMHRLYIDNSLILDTCSTQVCGTVHPGSAKLSLLIAAADYH